MAGRRKALQARAQALAAMRGWFAAADYVEVETPILQDSPGVEVHLQTFSTWLTDWGRAPVRPLHLHTSPEFTMKKLLVAGWPRICQFARVFRNGEASATHQPEFTMLEFYRAQAGWREILADTVGVVRAAAAAVGATRLQGPAGAPDPFADWQVLSMAEAFERFAGIELLACLEDPSAPDTARLRAGARAAGVRVAEADGFEDLVFAVMAERVEPAIGLEVPAVITHWPAPMAALARRDPDDPRVAERFEIYAGGLELANAFAELTDPDEQAARFAEDVARREALYGDQVPVDADFLAALAHGMPPAAGIALGVDRLVMLLTGATRITDIVWAPVAGTEGSLVCSSVAGMV